MGEEIDYVNSDIFVAGITFIDSVTGNLGECFPSLILLNIVKRI